MRALVALILVLAVAVLPQSAAADPCSDSGVELTKWLLPLRLRLHYRAPFRLQAGQQVVAVNPDKLHKDVDSLPEAGAIVELDATGTRLYGKLIASSDLAAQLRELKKSLAISTGTIGGGEISGGLTGADQPVPPTPSAPSGPAPSLRVLLAVAPDVEWSRVVATARAAREAGADEIGFVFAVSGREVTPPAPSPIDKPIAAIVADTDPSKNAVAARRLLDDVVARCPDARPLVDANDIAYGYADTLLSRCNCAVDMPSLRAYAWFFSYIASPMMTVRAPLTGRRAVTIKQPARTPWSKAHNKLLAQLGRGRPITLR